MLPDTGISRLERMVDITYSLATQRDERGPGAANVACTIWSRNGLQLEAVGFNTFKTHPRAKGSLSKVGGHEEKTWLHAEMAALLQIEKGVRHFGMGELVLVVARAKHPSKWDKSYIRGLAKPCAGCMDFMRSPFAPGWSYPIKYIAWTTDDGGIGIEPFKKNKE